MPQSEWYLKPWDSYNTQEFISVQIDPAIISGARGIAGPMLFLPYTLPKRQEAAQVIKIHPDPITKPVTEED